MPVLTFVTSLRFLSRNFTHFPAPHFPVADGLTGGIAPMVFVLCVYITRDWENLSEIYLVHDVVKLS